MLPEQKGTLQMCSTEYDLKSYVGNSWWHLQGGPLGGDQDWMRPWKWVPGRQQQWLCEEERQVTSLLSGQMTFYSFLLHNKKKMLCTRGPFNLGLLSSHLVICSLWLLMPTIETKHLPGLSKPLSAVSPSLLFFSPRGFPAQTFIKVSTLKSSCRAHQ